MPETSALLDVAYDAGIRHFDVARAYGRGGTELILGDFLKRRHDATVTTKYGILPPLHSSWQARLRQVSRPLVQFVRRSPTLGATVSVITPTAKRARFTADEARRSLEISLRSLKRDHIELFLMHEPSAKDLANAGLLDFLHDAAARGVIGAFGVGVRADKLTDLRSERPDYCRVMQFNSTAVDPDPIGPDARTFCITYRPVSERLGLRYDRIMADSAEAKRWSDAVGLDLSAPGQFRTLMLKAALIRRPGGVVLFSSTKPEHIRANAAAATDASLAEPALRLVDRLTRADPSGTA
jgi:aryl-alcohol dehydrogenase-like predicted oxidoreductase